MCPPAPLFSDSPTVSFLLPSFASSYEGCITQGYRITTASSLYAHKEPFLHCPGLRGFLAGPYESLEFRGASINVVGIFCPPPPVGIGLTDLEGEHWRCQRCSFVLHSALNCLNLKWQLVEHVG